MENKQNDVFDFEIIADGEVGDAEYRIRTVVIKMNQLAMNEWLQTDINPYIYNTYEEWEAYKARCIEKRKKWEKKVISQLELHRSKNTIVTVTQNVNEIFTVVIHTKKKGKTYKQTKDITDEEGMDC